jgi:hypothetical protein
MTSFQVSFLASILAKYSVSCRRVREENIMFSGIYYCLFQNARFLLCCKNIFFLILFWFKAKILLMVFCFYVFVSNCYSFMYRLFVVDLSNSSHFIFPPPSSIKVLFCDIFGIGFLSYITIVQEPLWFCME